MAALTRGWIPKGNLNDPKVTNACHNEDLGEFRCIVKHGQLEATVKAGVKFCLDSEGKDSSSFDNLTGSDLIEQADVVVNEYWAAHRVEGATCDFGGIAQLVEMNRTLTDDDKAYSYDDDEYFTIYRGPSYWVIGGAVLLATLGGGLVGFVVAMRVSKRFNKRVRESAFFAPIVKTKNPHLRSSLALDAMLDMDELTYLVDLDDNNNYGGK